MTGIFGTLSLLWVRHWSTDTFKKLVHCLYTWQFWFFQERSNYLSLWVSHCIIYSTDLFKNTDLLRNATMCCLESCNGNLWQNIKAGIHQADFKELAATKADGFVTLCRQLLDKKAALEHNAQTTADCKLTCAFCSCMRGINYLCQQLSIEYIRHLKVKTETRIYQIHAYIRIT